MTHKKLTLFGANKRPPKSRSKLLIEFHFVPHRRNKQQQQQQQLHSSPETRWTNLFTATLIVAIIALVQVNYCSGSKFIALDEAANDRHHYHQHDTQDKFSEMSMEVATTTTTKSINISEQQNQQMNSSAEPIGQDSIKFPLYMRIIATLFCLLIFSVGVCGNLLVPLVVIKTKYLRNSTNLFLINLSIADLLVLIVCMPTVLIELHSRPETWLLGEPMCKLSNYVEMLAANGSIFTILAISFERYYAICKPLKAGYKCTRLRATIIICLIWLLASILTSPILIMAKSSQTIYIDGSLVYNCILETDTYWHKMYVYVSMFAFFCLPLLVLMLVYWLIGRRLIRENLAMSRRTATSHCPSTATASTDLIHSAGHHHPIDGRASGAWYQAVGIRTGKRIELRKAASLKSLSSFFSSFGHHNHDNNHHNPLHQQHHRHHHHHHHRHDYQQNNQHHPTHQQQQQHPQPANGQHQLQLKRQLRLKAGKAFSLDSHSRDRKGATLSSRTTTVGRHEPPIDGAVCSFKGDHHGLSPNSCVGQCCCCCCSYCCCSCCCRHHHGLGLGWLKLSARKEKKSRENSILSLIFNQLQPAPKLWRLPCFWSMEKSPPSCSNSIETGSNQDAARQNDNDCNDDDNINSHNDDNDYNDNGNDNFDVDPSTSGGSYSGASDINGPPSSSCHLRRTDGITIMNSISESMPIPAAGEMGGRHSQSANPTKERLLVAPVTSDPVHGESGASRSQQTTAAAHHQLPAEYANDDDDLQAASEGLAREEEVDDPGRGQSCGRTADGASSGKLGLRSWLANTLGSYSRAPCSRHYCRSSAGQKQESRSGLPDNGPSMAAGKAQGSSGPLIAIRQGELRRQQCQHHQCRDDNCDDKSEALCKEASRCIGDDDDSHYEHRQGLQLELQQAKKSARFDIPINCTLSTGCPRQRQNESPSWQRAHHQQTATNPAASQTTTMNADAFDSLDCTNAREPSNIGVGMTTVTAAATAKVVSPARRLDFVHESGPFSGSQSSSPNSSSKSASPDSILQGLTFRRQHQSDQIKANPLEGGSGALGATNEESMLLLQDCATRFAAYPIQCQQFQRALETATSCSRPSSVAALSGSSASSGSCGTNTTTIVSSLTVGADRDSMGKSSATATATTTILFAQSEKSYKQPSSSCQEVGKQTTPATRAQTPITSTVMASPCSPKRMSSDQFKINDKTSRANSLVLDGESSVKGGRLARMGTHHLAKRFRTRSASKPIVCSQLHNGAHLSELLVVQDLSKKQQMDSRRQVVIMLAFVVACFFLLFFPYRVFTIWLILSTEDQVQSLGMEAYYNLTYFSRILIYLHSAINPIAYNLISTKFRRAFMSILLCRGSSTRRHFTTDHQQRLASYNQNRKTSNSTNKHQQPPFKGSVVCQPLSTKE